MSVRRLSDTALSGVAAGASAGQLASYNAATGHFAPTSGAKLNLPVSTYNFSSTSLKFARAAAARSASGGNTFHIATTGDSTTTGSPGPSSLSGTWPQILLSNLLAHGSASRGTGMMCIPVATRSGGPATTSGMSGYAAGIAQTGQYLLGGSSNTLTLTANTDQFRVMYHKRASNGGTAPVTVDGSAVASIDCSATGGTGVFFATYNVTQGSHTLVLTAPASGNGFILGVEARANGATGSVKISTFALGGLNSGALADSTAEGAGSSLQSITALAADLLIVDFGINDYIGGGALGGTQISPATYYANLSNVITTQRAAKGDVLLVGWPPNGGAAGTGGATQAQYMQQLYALCDAYDVAMIDFQTRWTSYAISGAAPISYYADSTHPNAAGHADMGNAMYAALASGLGDMSSAPVTVTGTPSSGQVLVATSASSATWGALKFDALRNAYNLTPQALYNTRFAYAKARAGTGVFRVNCFGDSTTIGQTTGGVTTPSASWPARLRAIIAAATGLPTGYGNMTPNSGEGTWTVPGSGWGGNGFGYGASTVYNGTANTLSVAVSLTNCTGFNVYYVKNGNLGTANINIDGGSNTLISATTGGPSVNVQNIAAGAAGAHTLNITPASGTFYVIAVEPTYANGTVVVANLGKGGTTAANWASDTPSGFGSLSSVKSRTADLNIITLGINDHTAQTAVATYQANIATIITAVQSVGGDILLLVELPPGNDNLTIPWQSYVNALYALADTYNLPLVDLTKRWISNAVSSAYYADQFHPVAEGYWDIAQAVADVVLPA